MLLCSVVPRALGTHGVRVAAQHPGAPGSGRFRGAQTDRRSRLCLFVCICLLTAHRWQSLPAADTDGHCPGDEDGTGSSCEGLQLHPHVQALPGPRRGECCLRPGGHGRTLYLRDHGHHHALFSQQEPQPQELDFRVPMPKYEGDLVKWLWLLHLEDLMADPAPAMQKPPGPAGS